MGFEDMRLAVESLTGGKNTVLLDDAGYPSIMVVWPKLNNKNLISGGTDQTHPGSIVNSVEKTMYISKYINTVKNGRAYSLPGQDPAHDINADTALKYCRAKGTGWGPVPFALRAQIALWCRANGSMPRGNTDHSYSSDNSNERGVTTAYDGTKGGRTATGSGPVTWNHNWQADGIADLCGDVNEWYNDFRIVDGEIQVIPYANIMDPSVSVASDSDAWKGISADGEYTDPGTDGNLKYDYISSKLTLISGDVSYTTDGSVNTGYTSLALESGLTVPELAKSLMLYPDEPGEDYGGDLRWADLTGERVALGGGVWWYGSSAGVFCVNLNYARSFANWALGLRSAYCDLSSD